MSKKIRHLTGRANRDGSVRYYWQPSNELRDQGWRVVPLGHKEAEAREKAELINADVDAWRRGELPASAPKAARDRQVREANAAKRALAQAKLRATGRRPASGISGVYLVARDDAAAIKVGIARDACGRVIQLQTGSIEALRLAFYCRCSHDMAVAAERFMLDSHADKLLRGEWLHLSPAQGVTALMSFLSASLVVEAQNNL